LHATLSRDFLKANPSLRYGYTRGLCLWACVIYLLCS
jgi:hypothetical protein